MRPITSRRLKEVKKWIKLVYERDEYECKKCGSKERLHAHHIKTWEEAPDLRVDIDNGITLCQSCHQKHHTIGKKRNKDHIKKSVEGRKGYRHSKETIEKLKLNAGRPKGIPWTNERKEQERIKKTGKKHSEETKQKIRNNAGRPKGPKSEEEKNNQRLYYSERELKADPQTGKRQWVKIKES